MLFVHSPRLGDGQAYRRRARRDMSYFVFHEFHNSTRNTDTYDTISSHSGSVFVPLYMSKQGTDAKGRRFVIVVQVAPYDVVQHSCLQHGAAPVRAWRSRRTMSDALEPPSVERGGRVRVPGRRATHAAGGCQKHRLPTGLRGARDRAASVAARQREDASGLPRSSPGLTEQRSARRPPRVTRQASAMAATSIAAASRNGAPGSRQSAPGAMDCANTCVNSPGPIRPASAMRLELAPCSWPCSDAPTRRLMMPIEAAPAMPHSAITGMPAQKPALVVASP